MRFKDVVCMLILHNSLNKNQYAKILNYSIEKLWDNTHISWAYFLFLQNRL